MEDTLAHVWRMTHAECTAIEYSFRSLAEVGFEPEVTQNPGWLGWMLHSPGASVWAHLSKSLFLWHLWDLVESVV